MSRTRTRVNNETSAVRLFPCIIIFVSTFFPLLFSHHQYIYYQTPFPWGVPSFQSESPTQVASQPLVMYKPEGGRPRVATNCGESQAALPIFLLQKRCCVLPARRSSVYLPRQMRELPPQFLRKGRSYTSPREAAQEWPPIAANHRQLYQFFCSKNGPV